MSEKYKGGVIVPNQRGAHGLMQLLMFHNREQIDLVYYSHPYDIEVEVGFHFLIVLSAESFERTVKFYDAKQKELPLLVHIDTPGALENYDHGRVYPGVEVMTIRQAAFDGNPDVTLELNLFPKIVKRLRESA
jgi:hypothetical protein